MTGQAVSPPGRLSIHTTGPECTLLTAGYHACTVHAWQRRQSAWIWRLIESCAANGAASATRFRRSSGACTPPGRPVRSPNLSSITSLSFWAAALAALATVQRRLLLDNTFVSDYDNELVHRQTGPARLFARRFLAAHVFVSVVTIEEYFEKRGRDAARELAARFSVLGLHVADALRCGQLQGQLPRRLGENDAWLATQALRSGASLVSRDGRFDDVPGLDILRYAG
jgi:predicted nucleic acid-binding protein